MTTDNKLYVKVECSVCLGKQNTSCPYCRPTGLTYIEAADKVIIRWPKSLDQERQNFILNQLKSKD